MADMNSGSADPHATRVVESQYSSRGVWLVKVPKYLADKMKTADGVVGKIKTHIPSGGGRSEVLFCLNDALANKSDETPTTHKFITSAEFKQNLMVLGETDSGKLIMDGKVIQRMECRPYGDKKYMNYTADRVKESNRPQNVVKRLDKVVNSYKPKSTHAHIADHEARKKEEGKRSRDDADHVKEVLFKAFEKHQYYSLRDLHNLSKQPLSYLKEILREICKYNMKAPHKNMYELKSEYRHYGTG